MTTTPPIKFRIFDHPEKRETTLTVTVDERFKGVSVSSSTSLRDFVTQLRQLADWAERQIP